MKTVQAIYGHLMRVGMTSHQSIKRHPFNIRNTTMLFILCTVIVCTVIYLIYEATNLKEYADSIFVIITVVSGALNFAFINWKMAEIFRFIDSLEDSVNTSKCYIEVI